MKIVVIGGTGLIGSKVVVNLRQLGHEVLVASPNTGVNTVTGEGLAAALQGAQVVVDLANSPSFEDKAVLEFFETSGRTERLLDSGYFRGKMAQEKLIIASPVPYTIVRSTQFFEFLGGIAHSGTVDGVVHMSPADVQPISSDDIAAAVTDTALAKPINGMVEVAGPERVSLAALVQRYLTAVKDPRPLVADPEALYFGVKLNNQSLTPGSNPRLGTTRFEQWLAKSQAAK
jgi:uncharacterized protein YbjT (DUF2867 family)